MFHSCGKPCCLFQDDLAGSDIESESGEEPEEGFEEGPGEESSGSDGEIKDEIDALLGLDSEDSEGDILCMFQSPSVCGMRSIYSLWRSMAIGAFVTYCLLFCTCPHYVVFWLHIQTLQR